MSGRRYRDIFDRLYFNSAINENIGIYIRGAWSPCWLWLGNINREGGYGKIAIRQEGKKLPVAVLAHRLSHELHMGRKLLKGEQLRHLCNNTTCIHPNHTVPGTGVENTADQYARGSHVNQKRRRTKFDEEVSAEREPGSDG